MPLCAAPRTAVVGTTSTFSAVPPEIVISAARPAKTVTSPGTAHVAVVPEPVVEPDPVPPPADDAVSSVELPARGVVMRRFVQVKAAGPPVIVTDASPGRLRRRYCWAGSRLPETENDGGATFPAAAPTASSCPAMTDRELRVPAMGASTSS